VQQGALLKLAEMVAHADGQLWQEQKTILETLRFQCSNPQTIDSLDLPNLTSIFESRRDKVALMLELIGVAYANGDYHELEKGLIFEIAEALELDSISIKDMENWVVRQLILVREANILMEG
jgi:hypothetical protein